MTGGMLLDHRREESKDTCVSTIANEGYRQDPGARRAFTTLLLAFLAVRPLLLLLQEQEPQMRTATVQGPEIKSTAAGSRLEGCGPGGSEDREAALAVHLLCPPAQRGK